MKEDKKMKNIYLKPVTEVFSIELTSFVCESKVYKLSRYAEWGDVGTYAPEVWVNEGHTPNISWPAVLIEEPGDLPSRSKGGLWTDDD